MWVCALWKTLYLVDNIKENNTWRDAIVIKQGENVVGFRSSDEGNIVEKEEETHFNVKTLGDMADEKKSKIVKKHFSLSYSGTRQARKTLFKQMNFNNKFTWNKSN
jgi:hypothetical protein